MTIVITNSICMDHQTGTALSGDAIIVVVDGIALNDGTVVAILSIEAITAMLLDGACLLYTSDAADE